ncbi:MAG: hypothetical protein OEY87_05175 [Gammaproteobacteria bacterium]|nr:hypothetical protein [Gammaproteobacteria bacterium]MDH5735498.1 hypothetical protein [Gammaproteobacteria bacterium]
MDIAIAGLVPLSLTGLERGQSLRRGEPERQAPSAANQQRTSRDDSSRVIPGEVLSTRPGMNRAVNTTQQSILERNATFGQSAPRQFSLRDAIATFEQNEALIADPEKPRQISGIIDVYV